MMPLRFSAYKRNPDAANYADELGGILWQGLIEINEPGRYDVKMEIGVTEGKISRYGGYACYAELVFGGASIAVNLSGSGAGERVEDAEARINLDAPGFYEVGIWQSCGAHGSSPKLIFPVPGLQKKVFVDVSWKKEREAVFDKFPAHHLIRRIDG